LEKELSVFAGLALYYNMFTIDCPQAVRGIPFVGEIFGNF
jgi:hypothetical protein